MILLYLASVLFTLFSFNFFKEKDASINDEFESDFYSLIISIIPIINIIISMNHIRVSFYGVKCQCGELKFNNRNICNYCESNYEMELSDFYEKRFRK
jgi:hypothetical protein